MVKNKISKNSLDFKSGKSYLSKRDMQELESIIVERKKKCNFLRQRLAETKANAHLYEMIRDEKIEA